MFLAFERPDSELGQPLPSSAFHPLGLVPDSRWALHTMRAQRHSTIRMIHKVIY